MADLPAVPSTGSTGPGGNEVEKLATRLRGELVRPGGHGYDSARALWNGMIDKRPALIARCVCIEDVIAAVDFARAHGLPLAVRGGGHGVAGYALCDDGLVVDLSVMRQVDVDAEGRIALAQGGSTLGDLDGATQRQGLATPLGVVTATGIGGLTLGGGMGWLRRKYGLSCDQLHSAQVVTADGRALTASDTENEDLFWAIRGGGGNFGVVTSFEYRLYRIGPQVYFCYVLYPAERAVDVLRSCERFLSTRAEDPEAVAPLGVLGRVPPIEGFPPAFHGEPFVALLALYPGDPAAGERILRPLREITEPITDLSGRMPYTEAQAVLDEDYPDGRRYYWKSLNVPELSDQVIARLVEGIAAAPSPQSTIDVWYQGGAMARVGETDTAFANRTAPYLLGIEANWSDEAGSDANIAWVRQTDSELRPFSGGGLYLNFPGLPEASEQFLREGYGVNYDRLVEIKTKYDPGNLFRHNANITPKQ